MHWTLAAFFWASTGDPFTPTITMPMSSANIVVFEIIRLLLCLCLLAIWCVGKSRNNEKEHGGPLC